MKEGAKSMSIYGGWLYISSFPSAMVGV
jgi:hypothetical protein